MCTHNDADHANGILGFLKNEELLCDEVWLPGIWTSRLKDILVKPSIFIHELVLDIDSNHLAYDLATLGDSYSDNELPLDNRNESEEYVQLEELYSDLEASLEKNYDIHDVAQFHRGPYLWGLSPSHIELFVEAINAAKLIKDIAIAAFQKGANIKWFEYDEYQCSGGIDGILEPLNSKEISTVKKRGALEYLALAMANRQSLVFHSPSSSNAPAILFSADSNFEFKQTIPWSNGMIITASHHGSKSNSNCYLRYENERSEHLNSIWIRSDGRFRSRPGPWYLKIQSTQRYCTRCSPDFKSSQNVEFTANKSEWQSSSIACTCGQK
ncbi:hypothetical protein ABEW34_14270 [Paenibacillus algorifonticola]|uniref:hypothetical protein n=1 Tax=Paenibacillus algorifonticola TaxID=684063 RepID=UPI003D273BD0